MKIVLVQNAPRLNRSNLESVAATASAQEEGCTVVFPELALNGYLLQDRLFEDAWETGELSVLAEASLRRDIVVGAAVRENGRIYNSALYFSGGKLLHLHHKTHLPNYGMFEEARYFFKGDGVELFETAAGSTAMLVCEDLWRAETLAEVARKQPDMVYVIANSPARGFEEAGLEIEAQWDALLKSLALLGSTYVVFVNRVGFEDGLGFWGGSRVITPAGETETKLPLFTQTLETVTPDRQLHRVRKWLAKFD